MPAWFIDGEITGQVTRSGMEVRRTWMVLRTSEFHDLLGIGGGSIAELVRMASRTQSLSCINARLRIIGICLVGSIIWNLHQ